MRDNNKVEDIAFNFQECIGVVSGGSQGIGKAIINELINSGAKVYSIDPKFKKNDTITESSKMIAYEGCTDNEDHVREFKEIISRQEGKIDFLVNNAGIYFYRKIEESTTSDFNRIVDVNLRGTFNMVKYLLPLLRKSSRAAIVNVASVSGQRTEKGHSLYSMTKGGILALTKGLAADFGEFGIRVNSVSPGNIKTRNKIITTKPPR